jgi:protease I
VYFDNHAAIELARKAFKSTKVKVLAAICAAVGTLAYAGVLQGKRATSHESVAELVRPRCGEYTGADVTVDGKLITADGPGAAKHFGEEILRLLG